MKNSKLQGMRHYRSQVKQMRLFDEKVGRKEKLSHPDNQAV